MNEKNQVTVYEASILHYKIKVEGENNQNFWLAAHDE